VIFLRLFVIASEKAIFLFRRLIHGNFGNFGIAEFTRAFKPSLMASRKVLSTESGSSAELGRKSQNLFFRFRLQKSITHKLSLMQEHWSN
jgi:hypothetical protein